MMITHAHLVLLRADVTMVQIVDALAKAGIEMDLEWDHGDYKRDACLKAMLFFRTKEGNHE